jgi:hypothetical protein
MGLILLLRGDLIASSENLDAWFQAIFPHRFSFLPRLLLVQKNSRLSDTGIDFLFVFLIVLVNQSAALIR